MRLLKESGADTNLDPKDRLRRRWKWANARRIGGVPSPYLSAKAVFFTAPLRPRLFQDHPEIAALTCVRESVALPLFFDGSTTRHLPSPNGNCQRLDFYLCAKSSRSSSWIGVAVLGKGCFSPLRSTALSLARDILKVEFPLLSRAILLAQMVAPTRLSLIEIADIEPRVTVSNEQQFELIDPDRVIRAA